MAKRPGPITPAWWKRAMRLARTAGRGRDYLALLRQQVADDPEALWLLASDYQDGLHDADGTRLLRPQRRKAVELYRRGAELGHVSSMINLASILSQDGDVRGALRLERRAFRAGDCTAAYNAGISYRNLGDHRAAVRWFRRAAAAGDESAELELAKAELLALGTRRNVKSALARLQLVAKAKGVSEGEREQSLLMLATIHLDGWLVPRDYRAGRHWLTVAERRGSTAATGLKTLL